MSRRAQEEAAVYQELAEEAGARAAALQAQFDAQLKTAGQQASTEEVTRLAQRASDAAKSVLLDEADTRQIIDLQLLDAGWEADTVQLTHARGARPERGRNMAIAEWPTQGRQSADYVLFAGLTPIATVEAKRRNINVPGKIGQAERYARGLSVGDGMNPAWTLQGCDAPWADGQGGRFQVPFVYSSNGRPFVKQLAEASGTWFRDARAPANTARPLAGFHSPQGLLDMLTRSRQEAEQQAAAGRLRLPAPARLPGQGHRRGRSSAGRRPQRLPAGHGHRHRQDAHHHRPDVPAAEGRALPPHPLPRRPHGAGHAGPGGLRRSAAGAEPAAVQDLQRGRAGRHGGRGRDPRAGGHRAGHGQARVRQRHAAAGGRLRLHHRRRGPPRLRARPGDDRGRAGAARPRASTSPATAACSTTSTPCKSA